MDDSAKLMEALEAMKKNLLEAKKVIVAQEEVLGQFRTPPFLQGIVIGGVSLPVEWSNFTKGLRVKLRRDSQFAHQSAAPGVIQKIDGNGWAQVLWDKGSTNSYRVGRPEVDGGACDLEFAENPLGEQILMLEGTSVHYAQKPYIKINLGDTVTLNPMTKQIIGVVAPVISGEIRFVNKVVSDELVEVSHQDASKVVLTGKFAKKLEKGDRVIVDSTATIILNNMGKDETKFEVKTSSMSVNWDDIGGLEDAKREMVEIVELPHKFTSLYKFYNKKPAKGILLHGPPGCGKTMLGKAAATAMAAVHKQNGNGSGFHYIKGPEILDKYVGVAEATIRRIFENAKKHKAKNGFPAVVFIDEADAILAKRGSGISSDINNTIVPMFLAEMDGMEESGALVLLATNRADVLDPAVTRDGRIDRKIKVTRPTVGSAVDIFMIALKGVPTNKGMSKQDMAQKASESLFSETRVLYEIRTKKGGTIPFMLKELVNGGMVVGIVDQAISIAIHKDIKKATKTGICEEDMMLAINRVETQNHGLNHKDELEEFIAGFREDVVNVSPTRR